jgi:4-hydroxy-3-polyprenylbenzoate decarboxylase
MSGATAAIGVGWTGASGLAYGVRLVEALLAAGRDVDLVVSAAVEQTAPVELDRTPDELVAALGAGGPVPVVPGEAARPVILAAASEAAGEAAGESGAGAAPRGRLRRFGERDFTSPLASGSARGGPLVICPCSMGTAGRIAAGTCETLLLRAADVCLKERRPLILVPREAPLATHHLENLARLSAWGALVLPAAPGFYHRPRAVAELVDFVVQRICDHLGVAVALIGRWAGPR